VLYLRGPAAPRLSSGANGAFHYTYVDFAPGAYAPAVTPLQPTEGIVVHDEEGEGPPEAPLREVDPSIQGLEGGN
jgi:hypothetical protein